MCTGSDGLEAATVADGNPATIRGGVARGWPAVLAILVVVPGASAQEIVTPQELKAPEVIEVAKLVRSYTELGLSPEFKIEGEKLFEGQILAADVLVFAPGSRLIFSGASPSGDRGDRYIVARTIRVLPGHSPPTLTWGRSGMVTRVPRQAPLGKAEPGPIGGSEGADGGRGADGQSGNPGFPGRSGPTVYVVVERFEGGPILVDLKGQYAGPGGEGQTGGDGGIGRMGRPAIPGLLDCREGGGNGGNGGKGGRGGNGGDGGRGGNGGTLVLLSSQAGLAAANGILKVDVSPGRGGSGGNGGLGGAGGTPGLGGSGIGLCGGGLQGKAGGSGDNGTPGQRGADGVPGIFAFTILTERQLNSALGVP